VDFFDPGMALGAGPGDVSHRNRRIGIRVWQNKMVSVAIIARGGDDQTPLEQAFSMDTLGIIAQNVSFGNVVNP